MKKGGYSFGGEQSGHIIFGNYAPTGDGTLVALFILDLMKRRGKKLSELKQIMHKMPQVLVNVKVKEKKDLKTLSSVNSKIKEIEGKLAGNGRVLVRYSGTENLARVMLEGQGQKEIEGYANEIAAEIKKEIGA
jgi:phosphoglucosamine mutase